MTENAALWAERVDEWRQSGKTAAAFVVGRDFTVSALRYWAARVGKTAKGPFPLARVVRRRTVETASPAAEGTVEVMVGDARILVRRGFDPVLVRDLVAALKGAR